MSPPVRPALTLRAELARKAIHVTSSVIPAAYALGMPRATLLVTLAALGLVALGVEIARRRSAWARERFVGAVGVLLREHEHERWSGATWLLVAFALAVLLFPRDVAIAAMLAAALGDASAAIVGRTVQAARARRGHVSRGKTLAGSVACATVTFVAASLVARLSPWSALAAALVAALVERWSMPRAIDDNVRVALGAGIAALVASRF